MEKENPTCIWICSECFDHLGGGFEEKTIVNYGLCKCRLCEIRLASHLISRRQIDAAIQRRVKK